MTDTLDSLAVSLERQRKHNEKLLNLLRKVDGGMDTNGRAGALIEDVLRTKQVLDDCERDLNQKRAL